MQSVDLASTVTAKGIVGDLSFGTSQRQILLIDVTILDKYNLQPGDLRENVTISGLRLSGLATGAILKIGETTLEITGDCQPCNMVETLREGLRDEIDGQRGLLARVLEGGTMAVGDSVTLLPQ